MDRDELIKTLREALDPASANAARARKEASQIPPEFADKHEYFIHAVARPIKAMLSEAEPFKGGPGFLVQQSNGWTGFHANEASIVLSRRVLRGETPEQAVGWLEKILATERANGIGVLALWGVQVASPLELGFGLTLLPFSSLPDSSTKRRLSQARDLAAFPGLLSSPFASPPKAALAFSHTVSPFLHPVKQGEPPVQEDPHKGQSLLDDARLALTLVGPSCPVGAGYWFQFADPDLADASFYPGVITSYQEVLPWDFTPDADLDPDESKRLVPAFLGLGEPLRATLRLSLRRFNQALRRPPHGDRAVDLAISLESLLVDGGSENTYKMGLRAALLLGGKMERRREVRAVVGALYTLRSALVHDGVLPSEVKVVGAGKRPAPDVVKDATEICARVLRSILEAGSIPSWYEYELADTGRPS